MRLKIIQLLNVVVLCALGCERPLTFDARGVAHGTGERTYNYKSGAVQLREDYVDGELVRSRWFKPDGTLVQETEWIDGTGEGVYLRQDGSIRVRKQYVNGIAEGEVKEYDEAGNVTKLVQYRGGRRVSESEPPATRPSTRSTTAIARDEVIAIVAGDQIQRGEIERAPERYANEHWYRFHGRVLGGLLRVYKEEQGIEVTDAEIDDYLAFFMKHSREHGLHIPDVDPKSPAIREMGAWWVRNWKISKALYEQYGGTVIWNQGNPQDPVGAYRSLFREHEARGTVTILDPEYRERLRQWLDSKDSSFVIPPEDVDFSVPWWQRVPQTQPAR